MIKKLFILFILILATGCGSTLQSQKNSKSNSESAVEGSPYDSIDVESLNDDQNNNKLKVAVLLPLSGKAEKIGDTMFKAAQLSMFNNKLNNIVLMPYDTKGTSFGAVDAMNEAMRDGAEIVIGPLFTQTTKAIMDIADVNRVIVLSFSDNETLLDPKYNNIYLMSSTPRQEIYRIVSYLVDHKNFYGFSGMFPNDSYGNTALKSFKEIANRKDTKMVKTDFYSKDDKFLQRKVAELLDTNTYKDEVYKKYEEEKALAKASGMNAEVEFKYTDEDKIFADALLLPDSGDELLKIGEIVANYNQPNKPIMIGTSKWLNNSLYNNVNFDNALFSAPNPNNYTDFENMYYDKFGVFPYRISSLAYDAVTAVMESYAASGNKENIKYALENYQGFNGVNGRYRFLSTGLVERKLAILRISNGGYEIIDYDNRPFLKY